jgi:ssDNA-binding Zn-finger/Zn-ribbon topoisomerase 1
MAMDVEPGFPCPKCGTDVQVFYSSKTGENVGWSCPSCRAHGYFLRQGPGEKTVLLEA